jgi:hypothetical protein
MDLGNLAEWAGAVVNGLIAYAGLRGVKTWRDQLRGGNEYQLAQRVLKCIYDLDRVCHKMVSFLILIRNNSEAIVAEFEEALTALRGALAEARVIWGNEAVDVANSLIRIARETADGTAFMAPEFDQYRIGKRPWRTIVEFSASAGDGSERKAYLTELAEATRIAEDWYAAHVREQKKPSAFFLDMWQRLTKRRRRELPPAADT